MFHFALGLEHSITCPEEKGLQRGSKILFLVLDMFLRVHIP